MKHLVTLLAALMIVGCTVQTIPPLPDADFPVADAGVIEWPEPPACDPENVDSDYYHCGMCDNRCSSDDADHCEAGECRCGAEPACTGLTDCRVGRCVDQDPEGMTCEFDGECRAGYACIEAHCSFVECVPEVCDGYDNDCDGEVDNNGPAPLAEYCYSGDTDPSEPILPPCQRGIRTCISGEWTECIDEIPPVDEVGVLGCDGVDNDCDGCVDGIVTDGMCMSREPSLFDVLFVIDQSGSMAYEIEIVKQASRLFSARLSSNPAFRWGIVQVPSEDVTESDPELLQDLTTFALFAPVLASMETGAGGSEPQWDAVYEAVSGELGVSWRAGAVRIIILFTDEHGQSTRMPRIGETEMCAALTHGEVFIPVVLDEYLSDFDYCAHTSVTLPSGNAGSGEACVSASDCEDMELCEASACVTQVVVDTAAELDTVIGDPCHVSE